jgi:2-iminobutanoate/2-iminopropanoate deaminase
MSVERINPTGLHAPVDGLYTHVVKARGTSYRIGGQVAVDADARNLFPLDMARQIRSCYQQIDIALRSQGLTWADVVHLYTFTTDMDDYLKQEKAIAAGFFGDQPPASTLVEVTRLVDRDWLVEVQADAVGNDDFQADAVGNELS